MHLKQVECPTAEQFREMCALEFACGYLRACVHAHVCLQPKQKRDSPQMMGRHLA